MMLTARFPTESFNDLVRNGEAGPLMQSILAELKPEAVYFTDDCGERTAVLIIDMEKASDPEVRRAVLPQVQCGLRPEGRDEPRRSGRRGA
jgi:hypothetical protein